MSARVLVVDDIPANVRLLEAKLSAEYFDVMTADSGAAALESIAANSPDIVLLDVMMPGMDGFEVCQRLKANPRTMHIPVVMVTALSEPKDRVRGLEARLPLEGVREPHHAPLAADAGDGEGVGGGRHQLDRSGAELRRSATSDPASVTRIGSCVAQITVVPCSPGRTWCDPSCVAPWPCTADTGGHARGWRGGSPGASAMTPKRVEVTRPDKLLWPALGITKRAYVDYLGAVAGRMVPWLRDRPLSVIRAPDGVDAHRYFQKNTSKHAKRTKTASKSAGSHSVAAISTPASKPKITKAAT